MKIAVVSVVSVAIVLVLLLAARCSLPEDARDGAGGGFWLVWLLDKTVGLPEPEEKFPDHAATYRTFLDRFDAGDLDGARALMTPACRTTHPADSFRAMRRELGGAAASEGERRWNTLTAASVAHTEVGARATFSFRGTYAAGDARFVVVVVRTADGLRVDGFEMNRVR